MTDYQRDCLNNFWEEAQDLIEAMEAPHVYRHTSSIRQKLEAVKREIENVLNQDTLTKRDTFDPWDVVDRKVKERQEVTA